MLAGQTKGRERRRLCEEVITPSVGQNSIRHLVIPLYDYVPVSHARHFSRTCHCYDDGHMLHLVGLSSDGTCAMG
jgi:hypothetical protein